MEREWRLLTKLTLDSFTFRTIIAPKAFHERLRTKFPHLEKIKIEPIPEAS